jgi:hypothetical protein
MMLTGGEIYSTVKLLPIISEGTEGKKCKMLEITPAEKQ